jgi:hypothetical protein
MYTYIHTYTHAKMHTYMYAFAQIRALEEVEAQHRSQQLAGTEGDNAATDDAAAMERQLDALDKFLADSEVVFDYLCAMENACTCK